MVGRHWRWTCSRAATPGASKASSGFIETPLTVTSTGFALSRVPWRKEGRTVYRSVTQEVEPCSSSGPRVSGLAHWSADEIGWELRARWAQVSREWLPLRGATDGRLARKAGLLTRSPRRPGGRLSFRDGWKNDSSRTPGGDLRNATTTQIENL